MSQPLISIVLPTFNGARYLSQAIQSCISQNFTNWELIVVDDASTDETPSIIQHYVQADKRIRSIRNLQNQKLPSSLNVGFAAAKGTYFTWTSDDNCYRPEALSKMLSFLTSSPQSDLVYTDFTIIDEDARPLELVRVGEPETIVVRNCVGGSFLYRRAVHERLGGYDESLFLVEDYDFWLRAFCSFQLSPLHHDLYLFRRHSNSLTSERAAAIKVAKSRAKEKSLVMLERKDPLLAAKTHLSLIDQALASGELARARRHAFATLRSAPQFALKNGYKELFGAIIGLKIHRVVSSISRLFLNKKPLAHASPK